MGASEHENKTHFSQKILYLLTNWAVLSFFRRAVLLKLRLLLWIAPLEHEVVCLFLVTKDRPNPMCDLSPCDPSWWKWEYWLWQWCWKFVNYDHLIVVLVNCHFVWLLTTALGNVLIQTWVSKLPKYARGWYTASQHIIYRSSSYVANRIDRQHNGNHAGSF